MCLLVARTLSGIQGDVVTLRAVERFESILPVAAGLVGPAGVWQCWLERRNQAGSELCRALQWSEPARLPLSANRVLIIGSNEPELVNVSVVCGNYLFS